MRKLFMLVTMLIVPSLASAWTMPVKVTNTTAGINAGNAVLVNYSTGMSTQTHYSSGLITAGTKYVYPPSDVSTVKVTIQRMDNLGSVTVANVPFTPPVNGIFAVAKTQATMGVNVAYATAATAQKKNISLTQTPNGLTSLSIGSSSTTVGYSNVPVGTEVTVKTQPNTGSTLSGIVVNGSPLVGSTFTVSGAFDPNTVVATYTKAPVISATLSLATSGQIGKSVTATVAVSGVTDPIYAWTVNGVAAGSAATCSVTPKAGANMVQVIVSKAGATSITRNATIQGVDLVAAGNYTCTSCHSGSTPQVVAAYTGSAHPRNSVTCQDCHTTAPHTTTVESATCESCHTSTPSTTTHPVALTASKCLSCHDGHNPAQGIADLTPSNHPAVTLYTFEELGMQMNNGNPVPVQVDANGKGMPYSPKQTCGTAGCHVKNGIDYTYDKISDHAFHSNQGRSEFQDSADGKFSASKNKPWLQSSAMVGKW